MEEQKGLYGFSMPDRTTWVGQYDPTKPNVLEDIIIFATPVIEVSEIGCTSNNTNLGVYFASNYARIQPYKQDKPLARTKHFNPSLAIARWYLEPHQETL